MRRPASAENVIGAEPEGAVAPAQRTDLGQRLEHRRRGVPLAHGQQMRRELLQRRLDLLRSEHFAPRLLDHLHLTAAAACDLHHQLAEAPEAGDENPLSGFHQRRHDGFDGGARRAVDQQRPFVRRAEHLPVERHGFAHVGAELRIELTQKPGRHGTQHPRVGIDRSRPHQQPRRRVEVVEELGFHAGGRGAVNDRPRSRRRVRRDR